MRAGEITGFEQVAHPYNLRYAGDKAFNNSGEYCQSLCIPADVDVDAHGIVRKTGSQTQLVQFACSMGASIDPNRLYKLFSEESRSLNYRPVVSDRQDTVKKHKQELEYREAESERVNKVLEKLELFRHRTAETKAEYNRAIRELHNEKQRHRNRRIHENFERYKNEQPVIYLERQLAGKLVENKSHEHF
ncbi:hypothetical protein ACO22_02930 [Paracoccidioides brasiliensis]|uniref:Uncharacterized protein n=1 Tax=Paracoccidioides brasiliensis TaxID=121759 RepID=A0A1D2JHD9_PARBR|nr:hypothetical protein ACO22_02930 [Paracoccidioides brasiliensis]